MKKCTLIGPAKLLVENLAQAMGRTENWAANFLLRIIACESRTRKELLDGRIGPSVFFAVDLSMAGVRYPAAKKNRAVARFQAKLRPGENFGVNLFAPKPLPKKRRSNSNNKAA